MTETKHAPLGTLPVGTLVRLHAGYPIMRVVERGDRYTLLQLHPHRGQPPSLVHYGLRQRVQVIETTDARPTT